MRESEAAALYFNRDYSPFAIRRDTLVERELTSQGFIVKATRDLVMFEKDEILTGNGSPYTVFTPYKRRWLEKAAQEAPARFESNFSKLRLQSPEALNLKSLPLPNFETEKYWFLPAGENEARRRLKIWAGEKAGNPENTGRLENYAETRDFPELDSTSRLSPFLKFGALSVRQCYRAALNARKQADRVAQKDGCDTWISELVWRDFYYQILWHFPHVVKGAFHKKYDTLPWENDPGKLRAWQEGRTGYPLVDAGMRQLNTEYWMHNRLRMVTASFLTKHLLQNWQSGERYFWQQLVDADLAANNGGWQWSASTGTDAQPYFRIFNPVSQSQKFDPEGNFIRRYVPELSKVPTRYIHEPWKMPRTMQEHLGCIIGRDYPAPVVEHKFARERALEVYKQIK
jgi:deoxyribodipyrimidine photo-lyase